MPQVRDADYIIVETGIPGSVGCKRFRCVPTLLDLHTLGVASDIKVVIVTAWYPRGFFATM